MIYVRKSMPSMQSHNPNSVGACVAHNVLAMVYLAAPFCGSARNTKAAAKGRSQRGSVKFLVDFKTLLGLPPYMLSEHSYYCVCIAVNSPMQI